MLASKITLEIFDILDSKASTINTSNNNLYVIYSMSSPHGDIYYLRRIITFNIISKMSCLNA